MGHRFWEILIALLLILFGLLFILDHAGAIDFHFWHFLGDIWPVFLIILGLWLIYEQARKKPRWKTFVDGSRSSKAFGSLDVSPTSIEPGGAEYKIGFGDMKIDLSKTKLQPSENRVRVSLGFGDLKLHLPKDTPCSLECSCGLGDVKLMDKKSSGISVDQTHEDPGYASAVQKLKIYANCGVGDVKVTREQ
jgi:predicted membrane protein